MKIDAIRAAVVTLGVALAPLAATQAANAATPGSQVKSVPSVGSNVAKAGVCWRRVGPYNLQSQAYRVMRIAQARGYRTSNVYGIGGIVTRYSNRRYYFNVYYSC